MDPVVLVGVVAGGLLIVTAVAVFWMKKEFPTGGVVVTMVGLVLIGMSQFNNIRVSALGATVELMIREIQETAAAADEIASQTIETAKVLEATRVELASLTTALEARPASSVQISTSFEQIRNNLNALPKLDIAKLELARKRLEGVMGVSQ